LFVLFEDFDSTDFGLIDNDNIPTVSFEKPLIYVMPNKGRIYGVTVLGSQMYIIRSIKSTVVVEAYRTDNFTQNILNKITIPALKTIVHIASCSKNVCLYMSDTEMSVVHRYDCLSKQTTCWSPGGRCHGLSVTRRCNVLVTLPKDQRIEEYTTNGHPLRVIQLDTKIDNPRHCMELSNGQFVVTNGLKNEEKAGVHVLTENGSIVHSIGGTWQNPVHMTVAEDNEILMVDDCFQINNKVKVLAPDLTYLEDILIPEYELKGPSCLHFDKFKNRLYIGEDSGGRLFVLDVNLGRTSKSFTRCMK